MRFTRNTITLNIFDFFSKQLLKMSTDTNVGWCPSNALNNYTKTANMYSYHYWTYCFFLTFSPNNTDKNTETNLKKHNSNMQMEIIMGIESPLSQKRLILLKIKISQLNEHGVVLFMNTGWRCRLGHYFIGIRWWLSTHITEILEDRLPLMSPRRCYVFV